MEELTSGLEWVIFNSQIDSEDRDAVALEVTSKNPNVCRVIGQKSVDASGFYLVIENAYCKDKLESPIVITSLKDGEEYVAPKYVVYGDFSKYTTIYALETLNGMKEYHEGEEVEGVIGFYLSNDGSTWSAPSLDDVKAEKIAAMNEEEQKIIRNGVDVTMEDGTVEHFSLSQNDQVDMLALQSMIALGQEQIPWHVDDEDAPCKFYSAKDASLIIQTSLQFIAYHVTYFRDLRRFIKSLTTEEDVKNVFYGCLLPDEFISEPLASMGYTEKLDVPAKPTTDEPVPETEVDTAPADAPEEESAPTQK